MDTIIGFIAGSLILIACIGFGLAVKDLVAILLGGEIGPKGSEDE